jgi:hypothetical protein
MTDIVSGEMLTVRYDADTKVLYDDSGTYTAAHQIAVDPRYQSAAIHVVVLSDA